MFFFSSRRRHTRSLCDWSSDVCSSDLTARHRPAKARRARADQRGEVFRSRPTQLRAVRHANSSQAFLEQRVVPGRSEERRVGKSVDGGGGGMSQKKKDVVR